MSITLRLCAWFAMVLLRLVWVSLHAARVNVYTRIVGTENMLRSSQIVRNSGKNWQPWELNRTYQLYPHVAEIKLLLSF